MEILEGRICVLSALRAKRRQFEEILVRQGTRDDSIAEILDFAAQQEIPIHRVRPQALDARAHGKSHGGVLGIAAPLPPLDAPSNITFALLLDGVDDGRNLGYALRTAEAFGVEAVFLRRRAWDFDGGDVSRASSGAYERLPVIVVQALPEGLRTVGCVAEARNSIYDEDFTGPTMVAIGGEKRGLSAAVREQCASRVCIPTREGAPSLSLTHAAAVVMAEVARQRRAGRGVSS